MKSNIDLAQFKTDYYDPCQKAIDVAKKYGLNQFALSAFVRSLGWKNRRESGIYYRPNGMPDRKTLDEFLKTHTITQAAQHFKVGWKAIKKIIVEETGEIKLRRVGGCNIGCPNWDHCTTTRPETLPCEVYLFEDELVEMDDDAAIYYRSPDLNSTVRILS